MIAYLRLFRWPNILIIALTMFMVRYYLIMPVMLQEGIDLQLPTLMFILLVLSVAFIAIAGYVINDYFDVRIDNVNDPDRVILDKRIPAKMAIPLHATFTVVGVILGLIVSFYVGNFKLIFIHLLIGLLLWLYSARYKRKPLWGNLIVAFSSAMVVLIVWVFELFAMVKHTIVIMNRAEQAWIHKTLLFMAGYAFVISLIREMLKDMEDMEGDRRYGCLTLPVVIGTGRVKWIITTLTTLSMLVLGWAQIHLFAIHFRLTALYFIMIQFMLFYLIFLVWRARQKEEFGNLSQLARIIMVAGILAMQVYYLDF